MCYTGDWEDYVLKKEGRLSMLVKTALAIIGVSMFFFIAIIDEFRVHIFKKESWIESAWGFKADEL